MTVTSYRFSLTLILCLGLLAPLPTLHAFEDDPTLFGRQPRECLKGVYLYMDGEYVKAVKTLRELASQQNSCATYWLTEIQKRGPLFEVEEQDKPDAADVSAPALTREALQQQEQEALAEQRREQQRRELLQQ